MKMWISHPDCNKVIEQAWSNNVVGCPMYVLSQKLKMLKEKLKVWNKESFGNIHMQVKDATAKLDAIQEEIDRDGHTDMLMEQEKQAQINLENVLNMEECFWQEKAKVKWHAEGDRNTAYFHKIAKIKNTSSLITNLMNGDELLTNQEEISAHIVNHFTNLFSSQETEIDNGIIEDVIPNLLTERINNILIIIPSHDEIQNAVFSLNKNNAPGPDGFGAVFYQTFWPIIKQDVFNAVLQFFTTGWLLPNFNSNSLILIPKTNNADSVSQFRPIAVANFKFKIISKILADRLATIVPAITSVQQRGFIKGRTIKDCICLTSEAINSLHKKCFGGSLALKIDITKAFDSLSWSFLLKVLKTFGFHSTFCNWIHCILKSAKLSISFNGKHHGFFSCTRGVRQGDPLSPLLFCLAEEVISRALTKLVRDGHLSLIQGSRNIAIPSHILYADDIMLFCKGTMSNIHALTDLFRKYSEASGQFVNPQKSSIFAGSISNARLNQISNFIGFNIGNLPFTYLGVPIFKGKPKTAYFLPIADKIKTKFSAWKASLLSIAGRVQLIRSVIQSMLLHSILIYSWPVALIKDLERWMRNFIWSGDVNKRKLVSVAWHKVCSPQKEGGLGIRDLSKINEAANLKLCWELNQSQLQWAQFLKDKVIKNKKPIRYHVFSSIWSSIKHKYFEVMDNGAWKIGNGESINFWTDTWCGDPLIQTLNIPHDLHDDLNSNVSNMISNSKWNIPGCILQAYPPLRHLTETISLPIIQKDDQFIWKHSHDGSLSFKDAYLFHCPVGQNIHWAKLIWNSSIPPSKSLTIWRALHDKLPTDDNLSKRGCHLPSICNLCGKEVETSVHLFFQCIFAKFIWSWLSSTINVQCSFLSFHEALALYNRNWSPLCKLTILATIINCCNVIWFCRNQRRFSEKLIHPKSSINLIISATSLSGNLCKLHATSSITDFTILKAFKVLLRPPNAPKIIEVIWQPPIFNWIKCNIDGASIGNLGISSCGGIFRNSNFDFLGAFASNLGLNNSLNAELTGAMFAIEIAYQKNWRYLWIEPDSMLVTLAFKSSKLVPWHLQNRWDNCIHVISSMDFMVTHIYREGNHCADKLANIGLSSQSFTWWDQMPTQIGGGLH